MSPSLPESEKHLARYSLALSHFLQAVVPTSNAPSNLDDPGSAVPCCLPAGSGAALPCVHDPRWARTFLCYFFLTMQAHTVWGFSYSVRFLPKLVIAHCD